MGANNEVAQTRFAVSSIPGQGTGGGWQNAAIGNQVSRLSSLGKKAGPNSLLKVMAGDVLSANVQYYYKNTVTNGTGNNLTTTIIGALIQAITGSSSTSSLAKNATANISSNLNVDPLLVNKTAPDAANAAGNAPKAYLTILFFDERFKYVEESSTSLRVSQANAANASLTLANIKAPKNGYVYIYVSNESNEYVYFDNLQVGHTRGRIIEEDHYYAFGLKIAAISSRKLGDANEGLLKNNYQYQGAFNEFDEDIGWNDFALRNYDPQIGRWVQQDPFYQFHSPYIGMGNDPMNLIDPSGGIGIPCPGTSGLGIFIQKAGEVIGNGLSALGSFSSLGLSIGVNAARLGVGIANNITTQNGIDNQLMGLASGESNSQGIFLVFDGSENKLSIYSDDGTDDDFGDDDFLGSYDAHNNVASNSRGKWEDGIYDMQDQTKRFTHGNAKEKSGALQDSPNGRYGKGGIYRAKPFKETSGKRIQRSGMAIHAGRQYKPFLKRVTMGCIRTTQAGLTAIDDAIKNYGRLKRVIIKNNRISTNSGKVSNIKFGVYNEKGLIERFTDWIKSFF